jgi:hypothetical protein
MKWLPPPGPQRRRQVTLLAIMLVVLAVVAWRYRGDAPAASTPPASNTAGRPPQTINAAILPQPVSLEKLTPVPDEPENGRNLFRFGQRPAPPPPPTVAPPPAPTPPPAPPAPTGPPPIQLRLTGITTDGTGRPVAQLKDQKGVLFMGTEGMIVDGQYKIVKIGVTSVVVSYVDGTGQRAIPLG